MRILFLSPEVWPFSRVGGLAEVAHDLPLALAKLGHKVEVVTPKNPMDPKLEESLKPTGLFLEVPVSWRNHQAEVRTIERGENLRMNFICHENLFDREGVYGNAYGDYQDNAERFIFYSRAALELAAARGQKIDVAHVHDWTTGLVPLYLRSLYRDAPGLENTASLFTVHNLGNQGNFWHYDMPLIGLGWEYFTPEGVEFMGKISFLKSGLVYGDRINTVSPSYAKEVLTPAFGLGFEGLLQARPEGIGAVLNGIDQDLWNPQTDPLIAANYTPSFLAPKKTCSRDLRIQMGLRPEAEGPLLAMAGRLLDRRGLDLMAPSLEEILARGFTVILMGWGDDLYHHQLTSLAQKHHERLAVNIGYDHQLAHRLMAGADMILIASLFEPCGLQQMQAMRYGTVPVVRATGGLNDTVRDHRPDRPGVGFKFKAYEVQALMGALDRAMAAFRDPAEWVGIMKRAMQEDFSWGRAARQYEELYAQAIEIRAGREEGAP